GFRPCRRNRTRLRIFFRRPRRGRTNEGLRSAPLRERLRRLYQARLIGPSPEGRTMTEPTTSATRVSLLGRLRLNPLDQAAWNEFVDRYGPMIFRWCRQQGLQGVDAEDVTQNVLLKLARRMRTFVYQPERGRFRDWLRTVFRGAWCDFLGWRRRPGL